MADVVIKTLITFFCIYGLTDFLKSVLKFFFLSKNPLDNLVIVIKVLNSEKTLEGTIRMLIWKTLSTSYGGFTPNILIVDMGSTDSTAEIAKKLCNDYDFISYKTYDEYLKSKKEWLLHEIFVLFRIFKE